MSTLILKDIARTEALDDAAMHAVRGGCYGGWKMPSCFPTYMPAPSTTTTTVSIDQTNKQCQSNPTGNGSAVFGCGAGIYAENNQQGFNAIGGYPSGLVF